MAISKKITKTSSTHPPYLQMINEAIATLKDQKGSTQPAIAKFISEKYTAVLPPNFTKLLSAQLTRLVKSGKIVKVKNSYKIGTKPEKANLVSSTTKESKTKTEEKKATFVVGVEGSEKGKRLKMKRLSQVKTPEAMKKRGREKEMVRVKSPEVMKKREKMKRLSQVKTPEAMKKKRTVYKSTPAPKKVGSKK